MELGWVADLFADLIHWLGSWPSWAKIGGALAAALTAIATIGSSLTKIVAAVTTMKPLLIKLVGRNHRSAAWQHRRNLRKLRLGLGVHQAQALFSAPPDVADVHDGSGRLIWYGRFSDVTISVQASQVASYTVTVIDASADICWPDLGVELEDSPVGQSTFADLVPQVERRDFNATPQRISYSELPALAMANGPTTWWLWFNDSSPSVGGVEVPFVNGHYARFLSEEDNDSDTRTALNLLRNTAKPNSVLVHYAQGPESGAAPGFLTDEDRQRRINAKRSSF